jgi:hypothetical protein
MRDQVKSSFNASKWSNGVLGGKFESADPIAETKVGKGSRRRCVQQFVEGDRPFVTRLAGKEIEIVPDRWGGDV